MQTLRLPLRIALSLTLFAAGVAAQVQVSKLSTEQKELLALDDEWVAAEVGHDRAALERILHEDFVVIRTSGKTDGRKEMIESLLARKIEPFEVRHDAVIVNGDTAVVIDRFGTDPETKCTWVAVRRGGRWRVIAEQFTTIRVDAKK